MILGDTACIQTSNSWWRIVLAALVACAALVAAPGAAAAAPNRCEVLEHAKKWVDNQIYYSQGPWGGYCAGSMYCDPDANGACYRPDCSGYISAVWGLPAPGNTTYSFAGGPWNDGASHLISYDDLKPGDALNFAGNPNTGTGHIRLFGGWANAQKTLMWGYETSTCGTPAYRWERTRASFVNNGYVAIRLNNIVDCDPGGSGVSHLSQVNHNGAISVTNWNASEQLEVWVRGTNGTLHNAWSFNSDEWSELTPLAEGAACGFASGFWPRSPGYAEVFMPTSAGGAQHTWLEEGNGWQGPDDFEGAGMTQFATLVWPDRRMEIFALGADGAIHNRFWRAEANEWSEWYPFGGNFVTGVSAINWGDGRPELFATAADGTVWNRWWKPDVNDWSDWSNILGGELSSRPIPVRWDDGRLEVFGRGKDGHLYHAWHADGQWNPMTRMNETVINGEPSVVFNPRGNGGPFGPQVFARDENNRLIEMHMDNNGQWLEFRTLLHDQVLGSDPMGWIRGDGIGLLFAVADNGQLLHSHRHKTDGWQPWQVISGTTVDACLPAVDSPGDDEDTTPPGDDEDTTPPGDDEDTTPPGDDEDTTPPGDDEDTTPPGGDGVPGDDNGPEDGSNDGDSNQDDPAGGGGGSISSTGSCSVTSGTRPTPMLVFFGLLWVSFVGFKRRERGA